MSCTFIDRGCREWSRMWEAIEVLYGDRACENPSSGEVWQYMGTVPEGRGYRHEFRHRDFPGAGRLYAFLPASLYWTPAKEGGAA